MSATCIRIDPENPGSFPAGSVDYDALDRTTEQDTALQQQQDDAKASRDMSKCARRVRKRMGLSQQEFARRINLSSETIRNCGQGKRRPAGAAGALLNILDKAPETALLAIRTRYGRQLDSGRRRADRLLPGVLSSNSRMPI